MRPQSDRYAVRREATECTLSWGLILPEQDLGLAHSGVILATGPGRPGLCTLVPMECARGQRVLYSTRIDTYRLANGEEIDIVDEASIIGRL